MGKIGDKQKNRDTLKENLKEKERDGKIKWKRKVKKAV
jgi:hypothetical protein